MQDKTKFPAVFIGHGSPTNALEDNQATRTWRRIAEEIPPPRAILSMISAPACRPLCLHSSIRPPAIPTSPGGFANCSNPCR